MRSSGLLSLVLLLSLGCQDDLPASRTQQRDPATVVCERTPLGAIPPPGCPPTSWQPTGLPIRAKPRRADCDRLQDTAFELLESAQSCLSDDDCTQAYTAPCLHAFVCSPPVNKHMGFPGRIRELSSDYLEVCSSSCAIAKCANTRSFCDLQTKLCTTEGSGLAPDASVTVSSVDGGTDAGTTEQNARADASSTASDAALSDAAPDAALSDAASDAAADEADAAAGADAAGG